MHDILNWRRWNDRITLSGQPTAAQLTALRDDGVRTVVNLGPHDNTGALEDEAGTIAELGVEYVYIPVDFDAPTRADFDTFCATLDRLGDTRIHIHCIYNARVTAFMYRFAKEERGGQVEQAFDLMDGIGRPGGVWAAFIGKPEDVGRPNRYLGYEY